MLAGLVSVESQTPLGQKLPVKTPPSSSTLLWTSLSECLLTFVTLCGTHRVVSREIIVSQEQAILLPGAFGAFVDLREVGHRVARSRDTRTMANSARDGGQFARFGRAGAFRSRGFGRLRPGERYAASMGCSDRFSQCHEIVRTHLLRDSTHSCCGRRRSVRYWTSYRFLQGVESCC